jgi:hypothetical protein
MVTQGTFVTQQTHRSTTSGASATSQDASRSGQTITTVSKGGAIVQPLILPFFITTWMDIHAATHASMQIHLLSGMVAKDAKARISMDQKFLVLTLPMAPTLEHLEKGLYPFLASKHKMNCHADNHFFVLRQHGKVIDHKSKMAKLRGNSDAIVPIIYEQRIPLPFKCSPSDATSLSDQFFYGRDLITYAEDNSTHLHIELLKDSGTACNGSMERTTLNGGLPPNITRNQQEASSSMHVDGTSASDNNANNKRSAVDDKDLNDL